MSSVAISGNASGAGVLTIAAPNTASNYTLTLPAATGTIALTTSIPQIQPISASVAANALTISASALVLDFRSTTATSGTITTVSGTPANLTVPSNQSFGIATTGVTNRYAVLCFNNAGTLALALSPLQGGVQLDETNFLSPTTTVTNTLTTIYSTITASNLAYRVIGFVDIAYTNGTGYSVAPTIVQGCGGQALSAMSSIGYGQTWQNPARSASTTYYNTTGKPILFTVAGSLSGASGSITVTVNGVTASRPYWTGASWQGPVTATAIIPPGASYSWAGSIGNSTISELR